MGCWAIDSFGNDDAADWMVVQLEADDLSLARQAIAAVLAEDGYLDAPFSTEALAALEVVAAAAGRPTATAARHVELMAWIGRLQASPDAVLISDGVRAVDRIASTDSELCDLWEETDDFEAWKADVAALRAALQG